MIILRKNDRLRGIQLFLLIQGLNPFVGRRELTVLAEKCTLHLLILMYLSISLAPPVNRMLVYKHI